MDIHGVDASDLIRLSNMQFLHESMVRADRIMNF
jgi:hypothetical protein